MRAHGDRFAAARALAGAGRARAARCGRRGATRAASRAASGRVSDARAGGGARGDVLVGGTVLVGLMSGTSADGISAAAVRFEDPGAAAPNAKMLAYHEQPYASTQRVC